MTYYGLAFDDGWGRPRWPLQFGRKLSAWAEMDDDVEMVGEAPVAVEEVRKLSPEMEASRLIFRFAKEDDSAAKEALRRSILEAIEKNGAIKLRDVQLAWADSLKSASLSWYALQLPVHSMPACALGFRGHWTRRSLPASSEDVALPSLASLMPYPLLAHLGLHLPAMTAESKTTTTWPRTT